MTIEDRERNTEIPLYYWIREKVVLIMLKVE